MGTVSARRVYLHVGTHKTGTTSIQEFVGINERGLAERGIYVPVAGRPVDRPDIFGVGHHNVAWDLVRSPQFVPRAGSFDDLFAELRASGAPAALVTSEEFEFLHDRPHELERIAEGAREAGYDVYPVLYLRPQHEFAQSLYAQIVKSGSPVDLGEFLDVLIDEGRYPPGGAQSVTFDYEPFVEALARAFGSERLILRPYRSDREPPVLLAEFWNALTGDASVPPDFTLPEQLNVSPSIMHVLAGMYRTVRERDAAAPRPEELLRQNFSSLDTIVFMEKFDALTELEAHRMLERFGESNRRIEARFGVRLPFQTVDDLPQPTAERRNLVTKHRRLLDIACRRWGVAAPPVAGRHGQGAEGTVG